MNEIMEVTPEIRELLRELALNPHDRGRIHKLIEGGLYDVLTHPARFSQRVMDMVRKILADVTDTWERIPIVLDPFAGVGGIHHLRKAEDGYDYDTYGIEIEPEWAACGLPHGPMICADWLEFEWDRELHEGRAPDFIVTSPCYGNRMADHHDAKDGSYRRTYRHCLGRPLSDNNSGKMQWGNEYRDFHKQAWEKAWGVLDNGGMLILNVSDHIRKGEIMPVSEWHVDTILNVGFIMTREERVETPRYRYGENNELRVDHENVYAFTKHI